MKDRRVLTSLASFNFPLHFRDLYFPSKSFNRGSLPTRARNTLVSRVMASLEQSSLLPNNLELLRSGQYSDLTVTCM